LLFTYYNNPNAGLITFCSVSAAYGAIMARALIEEATEILVENAISR
jgi:energy-converting hydrogenase Eha subunit E